MELTLKLALTFLSLGAFVLAYTTYTILKYDHHYYPSKKVNQKKSQNI